MIRETGLSEPTIIDWCNFIRDVCEEFIQNNPQQLGGFHDNGEPIGLIIEIDESKYFLRKYERTTVENGGLDTGYLEQSRGTQDVAACRKFRIVQPTLLSLSSRLGSSLEAGLSQMGGRLT